MISVTDLLDGEVLCEQTVASVVGSSLVSSRKCCSVRAPSHNCLSDPNLPFLSPRMFLFFNYCSCSVAVHTYRPGWDFLLFSAVPILWTAQFLCLGRIQLLELGLQPISARISLSLYFRTNQACSAPFCSQSLSEIFHRSTSERIRPFHFVL